MAKVTGLGGLFYKVTDPDKTRAWYQETLTIDPSNADAYSHLGVALTTAGRFADAVEAFERALQLSPGHDPGLVPRDRVNHLGLCAVSGHKRKWLGHVAMVDALAAPAQHRLCNNSAQEPPRLTARQEHDAPGQ